MMQGTMDAAAAAADAAKQMAENSLELNKELLGIEGKEIKTSTIYITYKELEKLKMEALADMLQENLPKQACTVKEAKFPEKGKDKMILPIEVLSELIDRKSVV